MKEQRDINLNFDNRPSAEDPHNLSRDENMNVSPEMRSLLASIRNTSPMPPQVRRRHGQKGLGSNWRS